MNGNTEKKEYIIDATGQKLGRLATQIATILRGKDTSSFARNALPNISVVVNNASKLDITPKQLEKVYYRHSQQPGGLKAETRGHLLDRRGYEEVVRRTVHGMIPGNKLRDCAMKNLTIHN